MAAQRYSSDHDPRTSSRAFIGWWRLGITLMVAVMLCSLGALIVTNVQLGNDLKKAQGRIGSLSSEIETAGMSAQQRLDALKGQIERAKDEALKEKDLSELRLEIEKSLGNTRSRVERLEDAQQSIQELVESASKSVVFLQGQYQMLDPNTNKPLRYAAVDDDGDPLMIAPGIPLLDPDGDGPVYEPGFTGTGFVISADGLIMTNRHVALPWEPSRYAALLVEQGIIPRITRMSGFLPGAAEPFDVTLVKASDTADLALLKCDDATTSVPALPVSQTAVLPGTEVLVMGYPTGIRAVLARAGEIYQDEARNVEVRDHWDLAAKLAKDGLIHPLTSRGIVGQTSTAHIVYDAETTSGGSGGPVLTRDGQVVAVNTAILPDYDGSNLGVPANHIIELIQASRDDG